MTPDFPILRPWLLPEDVAEILKARKTGKRRWQCPCPAHADDGEHLVIGGDGDRLLVRCYTGCTFLEIIQAIRAVEQPDGVRDE
jgi:hypothetical protein